jgi:RNA polymerase sigma-70 factor (ECF subfamily)
MRGIRGVRRDEAFEAAFPSLYHRALAVATRVVGDPDSAEDVAAEALARTYVQWGRVRELPYLEAWVLRVTANVALDAVRRRKPALAPAPGVDPAEQVVDRLFVTGQLQRLSKRQQEVVVLRYVADLPEAEVASSLGVGVETVKEHAARAMRALRAGVEKEAGRAVV